VHTLALLTLSVLLWLARKTQLSRIEHAYLAVMMGYFFSFFWVGQADTFDLIWLTLFPAMAAFVVQTSQRLFQWLLGFQAGLIGR